MSEHWHKGRIAKIEKRELDKGDGLGYLLMFYEGDRNGYHSSDISVTFHKDGAIHFCGDPEHEQVYLYPSQVKFLRKLLSKIPQPPIPKFNPRGKYRPKKELPHA